MIRIEITQTFIDSHPEFATDFMVNLGNEEGGVYGTDSSGNQGGYILEVNVGNPLLIENEIFQVLVNNSISGSFPRFLNNLLQLVSKNVLAVYQDAGTTPMTRKQIMEYTSP